MTEIKITTKPSRDFSFMNVAVEWNDHFATVDSYLPHEVAKLKTSADTFSAIAGNVIIQKFSGGVKISAPNIRRNATKLYDPETQRQEIVDAVAVKLTKKYQALVAS